MFRTAKWLNGHKISYRVSRLHLEQCLKDSGSQARTVRNLLLFLALLFPFVASAQKGSCTTATCEAKSASLTDFLAALPAPGNTNSTVVVNVPNSSSSWTSGINYTVPAAVTSLTIQGQTTVNCSGTAGTSSYVCTAADNTVFSDGISGSNFITLNTGGASTFFRITGITIQGGTGTSKNQMIHLGGSTTNLRVDHCHFSAATYGFSANAVVTLYGPLEGVFDHNLFNLGNGGNYTNGIQVYTNQLDSIGRGDGSWAVPSSWGSQHAIFAEANTFVGGYTNDCNVGGHFVSRYNSVLSSNAGVQAHPTYNGGGRDRGCRTLEVYHDYFSTDSTSPDPQAFGMRGGNRIVLG